MQNGFVCHAEGPVGTHSLRKFPSTFARRNGCSKDDVDARGRWQRKRTSDIYVDMNLPFPDAKAAASLCVGGPIKYLLRVGCGISDERLRENVIVNMLQQGPRFLDQSVAMVLALPILWICYEEETTIGSLPERMRTRIREACEHIRQLEPGVNPVQRVLVVVIGF